jgi:vacuolar-type H+-ATPase subunit B/Vma2
VLKELTYYTDVVAIVGHILRIHAKDVAFGDLAIVENWDGATSLAQVIELIHDEVSLQVFAGGEVQDRGLLAVGEAFLAGFPG